MFANCVALQPLAVMHDAYRALLSDNTPHAKAVAANQLLKFTPIYTADTFESAFIELGLEIETARLEKTLVDAYFLGRNALSGGLIQGSISDYHFTNADWLSATIARTACFDTAGAGQSGKGAFKQAQHVSTRTKAPQPAAKRSVRTSAQASVISGVLIVLGAALISYLIYQSRPMRIKRVERLTRHVVAFTANADFDGKSHKIIVLDISNGGAKIECDHPPIAKERITLQLTCGTVPATIVWATAFYAGIMFDDQLSETDFQSILADDKVTTRSRLSNVF
ncbi:MAG: PilZ domain-containing protein [Paracoccaceae bacterium]